MVLWERRALCQRALVLVTPVCHAPATNQIWVYTNEMCTALKHHNRPHSIGLFLHLSRNLIVFYALAPFEGAGLVADTERMPVHQMHTRTQHRHRHTYSWFKEPTICWVSLHPLSPPTFVHPALNPDKFRPFTVPWGWHPLPPHQPLIAQMQLMSGESQHCGTLRFEIISQRLSSFSSPSAPVIWIVTVEMSLYTAKRSLGFEQSTLALQLQAPLQGWPSILRPNPMSWIIARDAALKKCLSFGRFQSLHVFLMSSNTFWFNSSKRLKCYRDSQNTPIGTWPEDKRAGGQAAEWEWQDQTLWPGKHTASIPKEYCCAHFKRGCPDKKFDCRKLRGDCTSYHASEKKQQQDCGPSRWCGPQDSRVGLVS